jgi:SAM-dependent methyltransferase
MYAIDASRRAWTVDEFYSRGPELVETMVDPVLEHLSVDPRGGVVLEIGCGIGRLFAPLSERFAVVIGLDVSDTMVDMGKVLCSTPATWIVGDGTSLTAVESGSVDHVLSYEVFQHIPDTTAISRYIEEIQRVLRPGATFQLQLRKGSDTARQALIRSLPRPGRLIAGRILRTLRILPVKGDVDTWLGAIVPPSNVLDISRTCGFIDVEILPDHLHAEGMGYWVIGRKPS